MSECWYTRFPVARWTDAEPLLKKFKAVKTGNVFCTTADLYQSSMELSTFLTDLHDMLNGETNGMTFLYQLN
jgi:iron complex transport system substrate-binding protein